MNKDTREIIAKQITEDVIDWFKDWSGGDNIGFNAKTDIYLVIKKSLKKKYEL